MKKKINVLNILLAIALALVSTTASAQRIHHKHISHRACYRPIVTTIVTHPVSAKRISNTLSKSDRLEMALAYLKTHPTLSISTYSKITGLTKAMAEAELNAFAANKKVPIRLVISGKKKLYTV